MAQNVIENEIFEHFRVEEKKITDATILLKENLMNLYIFYLKIKYTSGIILHH